MKIPPLLLGATLLFWGWQTKLFPFAVIMAVVLEGARLVTFRWDFAPADFYRIADVSSVILIGMLIYLFVSQSLVDIIFILLQWLPFTFFPLLAGQCYSMRGRVDIGAFFLTLRRKPGTLQTTPRTINLTYPYVILCILSAGAANVRTNWFYPGLCVLSAWTLWSLRAKRYSAVVWLGVLLTAGIGGYAGQIQLHQLQLSLEQNTTLLRWFTGLQEDPDPYQSVTAIGDLGTVKLSNRMIFRVKPENGPQPPLLFRETSYDMYRSSKWYAVRSEFTDIQPEKDGTTWKIPQPTPTPSQEGTRPTPNPSQEGIRRVTVSTYLSNGTGILKLPTGTFQIEKLPVGILAFNQFGALKVVEGPDLITYQVVFSPRGAIDSPPNERDLFIPPDEMPVISKLAEELQLRSTSLDDVLQRVSAFFQKNFAYSLKLSRQAQQITPLADFLLNSRTGHCEYFATATVLLLRAAGIPARYAVGYSVERLDQEGKWTLVRGRDAHAWTLVYLNGAWRDFDTTPFSWRQIEDQTASPFEFLSDLWSQGRFALSEWRAREGGIGKYLGWFLIPLLLVLGWKLYSKKRIKQVKKSKAQKIEITSLPGSDSEFYLIEQRLQAAGFGREPWEPLSHWIQRIEGHSALAMQALYPMLTLHYRYRFDPAGLSRAEKAALKAQVQVWLAQHSFN